MPSRRIMSSVRGAVWVAVSALVLVAPPEGWAPTGGNAFASGWDQRSLGSDPSRPSVGVGR